MISKYWFIENLNYNSLILFDGAGKMEHRKWIVYSWEEVMPIAEIMALENVPSDTFSDLHAWTQEQGVQWTIEGELDFHYKLLLIKSHPHIIYYIGDLSLLDQPILWIVWPRSHSSYATDVLTKLFTLAPSYQFVTISWLAPGVDQLCHRLSLQKWIPTIAVLGWWLKWFLSWSDRDLIQQIVASGGLVISEFKLNQQPQHYTFPQRNRIIAWLSDIVFLPEAGAKSGSLITAQFAMDMHKPLYWAPNNIFSITSAGINHLIASWAAHAVTDIQQFLDGCFVRQDAIQAGKNLPDLSADEQLLFSFLSEKHICSLGDFLSFGSFSSQQIISLLTLLEMKSYVVQESPGVYRLMNN